MNATSLNKHIVSYQLKNIFKTYSLILSTLLLSSLLFLFQSCQSDKEKLFTKLSVSKTNIDFINQLNENEEFNIIEYLYYYNGGGVAVGGLGVLVTQTLFLPLQAQNPPPPHPSQSFLETDEQSEHGFESGDLVGVDEGCN